MERKIDVLYAEDDDKMAKMVKNLLEDHEFHVRIACDGKRVWDVFQHSPRICCCWIWKCRKKMG